MSSKDGETSWQVESENLHSGSDTVVTQNTSNDVTGNQRVGSTHESTNSPNNIASYSPLPNPDILNDVDSALPRRRDFYANDNCEKVARANANADTSRVVESKSGSLNRSGSVGSSRKSCNHPLPPPPPPPPIVCENEDITPLNEMEETDLPPPPLPPKIGSPFSDTTLPSLAHDKSEQEFLSVESRLKYPCSDLQAQSTISSSEASIPGLGGGEPRTPSQYEMLGQKMIQEGFYSVPTKPPISPTEEQDLDAIQQALDELDRAAKSLTRNSSGNSDARSSDGVFESGTSQRLSDHNLGPYDNHLMTPIPVTFNEHRPAPDYASTEALSTFAVELEASFDRIRQSMSSEHLHEKPASSPLKWNFGYSSGALSVDRRVSPGTKNSRSARAWQNNSRSGEGKSHLRKESGETIHL